MKFAVVTDSLTRALLLCSVVTVGGCWGANKYPLAQVSGVVKLDGKPLANGFVNFQPKGGPGSTAITDAEGKYSLTTIDGAAGAVVGKHLVTIYSVHSQEAASEDDVTPRNAPKERVPPRYNYESTLTFEVPDDGNLQTDWNLSSS